MACDVQAVLDDAPCNLQFDAFQLQVAEVSLLCAIKAFLESGTEIVACDVQTLLTDNPCVSQYTQFQLQAAKLALLCDIAALLGATGDCAVFARRHSGTGSPEGVVDGCKGEFYVDTATGDRYVFVGTNGENTGWI